MQWEYKDQQEEKARAAAEAEAQGTVGDGAKGAGYLQLGRGELDDMSVDLSDRLQRKRTSLESEQGPSIAMGAPSARSAKPQRKFPAPSDAARWQRQNAFKRRSSSVALSSSSASAEEVAAQRAAERARYEMLQREYQLWTTSTAAVCFALVYACYTRVRLAPHWEMFLKSIVVVDRNNSHSQCSVLRRRHGLSTSSSSCSQRLVPHRR